MKADVSLVSFVLVLVIAVPVTALRSQTYSIGYEIAQLKSKERELLAKNLTLRADLAIIEYDLVNKETEKGVLSSDLPSVQMVDSFGSNPIRGDQWKSSNDNRH